MYAPFLHSVGSTGLLYAFLAFTEEYNVNNFEVAFLGPKGLIYVPVCTRLTAIIYFFFLRPRFYDYFAECEIGV